MASPRDLLSRAAQRAVEQPHHAPAIAREILALSEPSEGAAPAPSGYLYAPAHSFTASVRDLEVEPLPTADAPQAAPIWSTSRQPVQIKIPFNALIVSVSGHCLPRLGNVLETTWMGGIINPAAAADLRDLFTVAWGLDGNRTYSTDGHREMMLPASVTVGTRRNPRRMAWEVQRNQTIQVYFRNITNAIVPAPVEEPDVHPVLASCSLTFTAINLDYP